MFRILKKNNFRCFFLLISREFPLSSSFVDSPLRQTTPSHKDLNVEKICLRAAIHKLRSTQTKTAALNTRLLVCLCLSLNIKEKSTCLQAFALLSPLRQTTSCCLSFLSFFLLVLHFSSPVSKEEGKATKN